MSEIEKELKGKSLELEKFTHENITILKGQGNANFEKVNEIFTNWK
jgi:hypothetical protein